MPAEPCLYILSTPIGNLGDISRRALETLARVRILAAEDTRSARRLLAAYNLSAEGKLLISYGEHNEAARAAGLAEMFTRGEEIVLLSESGTPLVSDPGYRLVQAALAAGVKIVPIPGPSALLAALAGSGLPVHSFSFHGFPSKKPGARLRLLESLKDREETLIFYESPQRLPKILPELANIFGAARPACLARELTKVHETFWRLPLGQLSERVAREPLRGQCTLLVAGAQNRRDQSESPDQPDPPDPDACS
jgi:16S rRNA (cytidine1402-2'-O)-methyltransferase